METRELFERVVADEPPLRLSPALALRDGRRAATRRWSATAAGAVAVVVLSAGLVVRLAGDHRTVGATEPAQTPTVSPAAAHTPSPAPPSGVPAALDAASLPFVSLAQVQAVANQEYQTMSPAVEALTGGNGAGGGSGSRSAGKLVESFGQDGPWASVVVQLTVASPAEARSAYGGAVTKGPCVGPIPERAAASGCTSASLPGGGTLWSWEVTRPKGSTSPGDTMQRSALVVAADGSVLEVLQWASGPHAGARIPLPDNHVLDEKSLISLAEQATVTWVSTSRGFVAEAASVVPSGAGTSLGGPGITALPFRSAAQITASNAAVYARLVAAAGGKAALIKGWPTLQSGRISAKTTSLRTEVQWPTGSDSAYLDVVTSTPADARSWYGPALTSGACVAARGQASGVPVRCTASSLPGGARAWLWETRSGVGPPTKGATGPTTTVTVARNVLVVAMDGSTLALTEYALSGHQPGTGVATAVSRSLPGSAALVTLAVELAQAWQAAGS
jgi:hypothetical protein